jgi:hypothetical protein
MVVVVPTSTDAGPAGVKVGAASAGAVGFSLTTSATLPVSAVLVSAAVLESADPLSTSKPPLLELLQPAPVAPHVSAVASDTVTSPTNLLPPRPGSRCVISGTPSQIPS